jgi:hypothetical protein
MEKTLAGRRIKPSILVNDFYGHVAMQRFVKGTIDNPHASFAKLRYDPAMTEHLTDHTTLLFRPSC